MGAPEHEDRDKKRPSAPGPQYGVGAETAMEGTRRRGINRGAAETAMGGGGARPGPQRGGGAGTAPLWIRHWLGSVELQSSLFSSHIWSDEIVICMRRIIILLFYIIMFFFIIIQYYNN